MNNPPIYAVVPAAGIGKRMQSDQPKQYLKINDKTVLEHTLNLLLEHDGIEKVIVALHPEDRTFDQLDVARHPGIETVIGGDERSDSVARALEILPQASWALVHDAARPCLSRQDLSALMTHVNQHTCGAILAAPVRDTMKRASGKQITETVDRNGLWHALTPQLFPTQQLLDAYRTAKEQNLSVTDEASAIEASGHRVDIIEGHPGNIKITHPADLSLAAFYLNNR